MRSSSYRVALPVRRKERLKFGRKAAAALGIFALYCLVNVWQSVKVTHLIRSNEELRAELARVNRECDRLVFELERLKDLENIRRELRDSAPLVPAETMIIRRGGKRR